MPFTALPKANPVFHKISVKLENIEEHESLLTPAQGAKGPFSELRRSMYPLNRMRDNFFGLKSAPKFSVFPRKTVSSWSTPGQAPKKRTPALMLSNRARILWIIALSLFSLLSILALI